MNFCFCTTVSKSKPKKQLLHVAFIFCLKLLHMNGLCSNDFVNLIIEEGYLPFLNL